MADFQNQVGAQPAPGLPGDFCAHNPRSSVIAGPGGLVAGPNGALVGHFAWLGTAIVDVDGSPTQVNNSGTGPVAGFIHRQQQATILNYLQTSGNTVMQGQPIALVSSGDYWVLNNGTAPVVYGQKIFASTTDGSVAGSAAPGTTMSGAVETKYIAGSAGAPGTMVKMTSHPLG